MGKIEGHKSKVEALKQAFVERKSSACFSLSQGKSSNTVRESSYKKQSLGLDLSHFNEILEIDLEKKTVIVEPKVTMESVFLELAQFGLIPKVLPEFKGITVGGAVNGAAIESSSFRFGQFNDTCLEYEVMLGDGSVVQASKNLNADLFYGLSGSYGSLGVITAVKISLIESKPFVHLEYRLNSSVAEAVDTMNELSKDAHIDFLEAIVYSKERVLIVIGKMTSKTGKPFLDLSKSYSPWFYQHVLDCLSNGVQEEFVSLQDFLFRHDRAAFWMGGYALNFKILGSYICKLLGLKSPFKYKAFTPLKKPSFLFRFLFGWIMESKRLYRILHSGTEGWFRKSFCIQDYYIPHDKVEGFTDYTLSSSEIVPLWICPVLSTTDPQIMSPHMSTKPTLLFDVGVYGLPKDRNGIELVRQLDRLCYSMSGKKMFYGYTKLNEKEFWEHYPQKEYELLRKKYKAETVFHNIVNKILT